MEYVERRVLEGHYADGRGRGSEVWLSGTCSLGNKVLNRYQSSQGQSA